MDIAVFQTGTHTDMAGETKNWTTEDVDQIVKSYNPSVHEAPVVIGHPKNDSPAWGWVESLRREGNILFAKLKNIAPEFAGWINDGRYKKRSISLYSDLSLKHLGFLGAMPPAVKGLPDSGFMEDVNDIIIEFSAKEDFMELKEFFEGLKFWTDHNKEIQASVVASPAVPAIVPAVIPPVISYSEADIEAAKKEAAIQAVEVERKRLTLEFAEKEKVAKQAAHGGIIKTELELGVAAGKIAPAWIKAGIAEFMTGLDTASDIQFAAGSVMQTQIEWFRKFLAELPKLVNFEEFATRGTDVSGDPGGKLEALIQQKMTADKTLSYSRAFAAVQNEHQTLTQEYCNS